MKRLVVAGRPWVFTSDPGQGEVGLLRKQPRLPSHPIHIHIHLLHLHLHAHGRSWCDLEVGGGDQQAAPVIHRPLAAGAPVDAGSNGAPGAAQKPAAKSLEVSPALASILGHLQLSLSSCSRQQETKVSMGTSRSLHREKKERAPFVRGPLHLTLHGVGPSDWSPSYSR